MQLGYDARHGPEGESKYWEKVKMFFQEVFKRETSRTTKIVVSGDMAGEPRFVNTLREVVQEVFDCKHMEYINNDPLFGGARGTAQFAMRALSGSPYQGRLILEQAEFVTTDDLFMAIENEDLVYNVVFDSYSLRATNFIVKFSKKPSTQW
jgi:hypothetical protein